MATSEGPAVPSDEDELIAALAEAVPLSSSASDRAIALALLPVVRRYADQRAAEVWDEGYAAACGDLTADQALYERTGRHADTESPNPYRADALTREATT